MLYYMLLFALSRRLRARAGGPQSPGGLDTRILALLWVGDYRGVIHIPQPLRSCALELQYVDGVEMPLRRLGGTEGGLFGDPNDLGLLIASCVIYSFYLLGDRSAGPPRPASWVLPLPLLLYALTLTYSRGGVSLP